MDACKVISIQYQKNLNQISSFPQHIALFESFIGPTDELSTDNLPQKLHSNYTLDQFVQKSSDFLNHIVCLQKMTTLQHFPQVIGTVSQGEKRIIVMGDCGQSLYANLTANSHLEPNLLRTLNIGIQIISALKQLHSLRITYGQVGLKNIRVKDLGEDQELVYLSGLSKIKYHSQDEDLSTSSKKDVLDLFFMMSNMLNPQFFKGYREIADSSVHDLFLIKGSVIFQNQPKELEDNFEFVKLCNLDSLFHIDYDYLFRCLWKAAKQADLNASESIKMQFVLNRSSRRSKIEINPHHFVQLKSIGNYQGKLKIVLVEAIQKIIDCERITYEKSPLHIIANAIIAEEVQVELLKESQSQLSDLLNTVIGQGLRYLPWICFKILNLLIFRVTDIETKVGTQLVWCMQPLQNNKNFLNQSITVLPILMKKHYSHPCDKANQAKVLSLKFMFSQQNELWYNKVQKIQQKSKINSCHSSLNYEWLSEFQDGQLSSPRFTHSQEQNLVTHQKVIANQKRKIMISAIVQDSKHKEMFDRNIQVDRVINAKNRITFLKQEEVDEEERKFTQLAIENITEMDESISDLKSAIMEYVLFRTCQPTQTKRSIM